MKIRVETVPQEFFEVSEFGRLELVSLVKVRIEVLSAAVQALQEA